MSIIAPKTNSPRETEAFYRDIVRSINGIEQSIDGISSSVIWDIPGVITGLTVEPGHGCINLRWDRVNSIGHLYTDIWRSEINDITVAKSIRLIAGNTYSDIPPIVDTTATYYYWIRGINRAYVPGPFSYEKGIPGQVSSDSTYTLQVLTKQIGYEQFNTSDGVFPVRTVSELPGLPNTVFPVGVLVYLTIDGKLYRNVNDIWTAEIDSADIVGEIVADQVADAAITTASFAAGIEPVGIVDTLPSPSGYTGARTVFLTTDGKLYRYYSGAWTAATPTSDLTGTISDSQIANLAAAKLTGQIATTQITDSAITTPKINAGAVTTGKIAANAVTATEILAGAIITDKIAAGAVTANEIATGAIIAGKVAAGAISTNELAAGAVTTAKLAASAVTANELAANAVTAGKIAAGVVTASELASNAVTAGKIATGTITAGDGVIANAAITGAQIANATITSANIQNLNADAITAGGIRGINVTASSHCTIGSYLTQSCSTGASTLYIHNTEDFPTSGSGWIIDNTNDRDEFSWTGKTGTTLTGVTGVLEHGVNATIIPKSKGMVIDSASNEMRFYADRGDGTIEELASIGITGRGGSFESAVGVFGSYLTGNSRIGLLGYSYDKEAVWGFSYTKTGVRGASLGTGGIGLYGDSTYGYGVYAYGGVAPLVLSTVGSTASAPTHSAIRGSLWVTTGGILYINISATGEGTTWQKVGAQ